MYKAEQNSSPARGRPRGFDLKVVAQRARVLFSSRGLGGTSMDEIAAATGLFRTSLVAAFKNKRGIFLAALADYRDEAREKMAIALGHADLQEALRQFYANAIEEYAGKTENSPGCFLLSTAVLEASTDEEIKKALADHLEETDRALTMRFAAARDSGDLHRNASPEILAEVISGGLVKIAILARAGSPKSQLQAIAARNIEFVCGGVPLQEQGHDQ